jgi:uncharacterized protein YdeI (BOF family)
MTSTNYRYLIDTDLFINPNAYLQIFLPYSINNTNAIFQLQNQPETIFDEVFYDNAVKEGQSLIRSDGSNELQPVSIPTPGEVNIISGQVLSAEDNVLMTITQSKTLDPKTQVSIKGTITVDVGLLGNNIFYIQDETGGIQILLEEYNSNIIQKDIIIEAQGEIAIYHKETRLKVKTENINLINQSIVIQPQTLNIGDINEDLIGSLLKIKGNVIKTSGNIFYIQDKTGTLRVQIKDTTNIIRPDCRKGYYAEIVGILSVWDTTAEGGLNYRLLPRYQEDVYISKTLANTGGKKTTLLILLGFISLIFSSTRICKINEIQI